MRAGRPSSLAKVRQLVSCTPPFVRRITVMRCHSGIPPNRIGISWSQILTPRIETLALSSARILSAHYPFTAVFEISRA